MIIWKKSFNFQNKSVFKSNASLNAVNDNTQPNIDKSVIAVIPKHYQGKLHTEKKKIYIWTHLGLQMRTI